MAKLTLETRGSSMFTEISYDDIAKELTVRLTNGTAYVYSFFPLDMWNRFRVSASYGSFYNTYVKPVYQYKRTA